MKNVHGLPDEDLRSSPLSQKVSGLSVEGRDLAARVIEFLKEIKIPIAASGGVL